WSPQPPKESDNFQAKFLNMLFILGLLIGFMILASWALKRMMKARVTQINQTSLIKLLETRPLSPKSIVYLIEIENTKILVGESQNGLNYLASFPEITETQIYTE
ncbi:MAG TPA: flagellar biosynthetic protein FliO, partial [Cytophagales bacterium]|nr:flagellar biosynthetic protein FliO [Cytophagales bacterium]